MAGLLGIDGTWFRNNGKNLGDANNLGAGVASFYYGDGAASLHYPYGYGVIATFFGSDGVRFQLVVNESASSPHISFRARWDTWSAWKQIL